MSLHRLPGADRFGVRVTVPTLIKDFELRSGSPKIYVKTGGSGAKRAQAF